MSCGRVASKPRSTNSLRAACFNRARLSGLRRALCSPSIMTTCPNTARPMCWTFRARTNTVNARHAPNVYTSWLNTLHRVPPADIETIAFRLLHGGREATIQRPAGGNIFLVAENFSAQSGGIGCPQGGGFGNTGPFDSETCEIGQALAEPIIRHHAAIDFERFEPGQARRFHVAAHRVQQIARLV